MPRLMKQITPSEIDRVYKIADASDPDNEQRQSVIRILSYSESPNGRQLLVRLTNGATFRTNIDEGKPFIVLIDWERVFPVIDTPAKFDRQYIILAEAVPFDAARYAQLKNRAYHK